MAEDQRIRTPPPGQVKGFSVRLSREQQMEWSRVDVANIDRLREIVDRYGWPGRSLVGEKALSMPGCWPSMPIDGLTSALLSRQGRDTHVTCSYMNAGQPGSP